MGLQNPNALGVDLVTHLSLAMRNVPRPEGKAHIPPQDATTSVSNLFLQMPTSHSQKIDMKEPVSGVRQQRRFAPGR